MRRRWLGALLVSASALASEPGDEATAADGGVTRPLFSLGFPESARPAWQAERLVEPNNLAWAPLRLRLKNEAQTAMQARRLLETTAPLSTDSCCAVARQRLARRVAHLEATRSRALALIDTKSSQRAIDDAYQELTFLADQARAEMKTLEQAKRTGLPAPAETPFGVASDERDLAMALSCSKARAFRSSSCATDAECAAVSVGCDEAAVSEVNREALEGLASGCFSECPFERDAPATAICDRGQCRLKRYHLSPIDACFARAHELGDATTSVAIEVTVGRFHNVVETTLLSAAVARSMLGHCLLRQSKTLSVPQAEEGQMLTLMLPLRPPERPAPPSYVPSRAGPLSSKRASPAPDAEQR